MPNFPAHRVNIYLIRMHTCKALAENVLFIQRDPALEKTSCIFHTYPAHICILSCLVLTVQFSKIYFFFNISLGLAQSLLHAFTIFSWPAKQCNPPPPHLWQLFSQHKHWHSNSHLLVSLFILLSLDARLLSLGLHHRAGADRTSKP